MTNEMQTINNEPQEITREAQIIQGQILMAKQFPRNATDALNNIVNACTRPSLAEVAIYQYPRGGTDVTGASIRLVEAIAQLWGNIDFGVREVERIEATGKKPGESRVETFAWDMENNTRSTKSFIVRHVRNANGGIKNLKTDRDIYETIANDGARRLRSCLTAVIPPDIIDVAMGVVYSTQKSHEDVSPEGIRKMLDAFEDIGVSKEMIENFIQRNVASISPAMKSRLRRMIVSIKNGLATTDELFPNPDKKKKQRTKTESNEVVEPVKKENPKQPKKELVEDDEDF